MKFGSSRQRRTRISALLLIVVLIASSCNEGVAEIVAGDSAGFGAVGDVLALPNGDTLVVDESACEIKKVDTTGAVSVVAGTGTCGFSGDGGPATAAEIKPTVPYFLDAQTGQLALDSSGNIYLADTWNGRIRKISTDGTIDTIVGGGASDPSEDYKVGSCRPNNAFSFGLTVTPDGTVYFVCPYAIEKVNPDKSLSSVKSVQAGALTSDSAGNLYYDDLNQGLIMMLNTSTGVASQFADLNSIATNPSGKTPIASDLAFGTDGKLYAALGPTGKRYWMASPSGVQGLWSDQVDSSVVVRLDPSGPMMIAGNGHPDPSTGTQAGYARNLYLDPMGLTFDSQGSMIISSAKSIYRFKSPNLLDSGTGRLCPPAKGPGTDASGLNLSGLDFRNCNLSGWNFTGSNLTNANFGGANLSGAILTGTNLQGASLSGVTSNGPDLISSGGITGTPSALPTNWEIMNGWLVAPHSNLAGVDLSGWNFSGADLTGANLDGATVQGADFTGAASVAKMHALNLSGVVAQAPTGWSQVDNLLIGPTADISNATIGALDFSSLNLDSLVAHGTNFSGTILTGTYLTNSDLTGANLTNEVLNGTYLTGANLSGATVQSADFSGAASVNAMCAINLVGTIAQPPSGWAQRGDVLVGPGADISHTTIGATDLSNLNLTSIEAVGTVFNGTSFSGANLTEARLTSADLTNDNLTNANLTNAMLVGATVQGTDMSGATAVGLKANKLVGTVAQAPVDWQQFGNIMLGPQVDLSAMDLHNIDITGANLTGADLSNTNLAGANLTNANLTGATINYTVFTGATITNATFTNATMYGVTAVNLTGTPASLPAWWRLINGALIGRASHLAGVNLAGANLYLTDFTSADLTGANLSNAKISSATFSSANLTNTNFGGATGTPAAVASATYANTICPDLTVVTDPATCVGHGF